MIPNKIPNESPKPVVLVIDDDAEIRMTIQDILEDQGFTVASAGNGRDALEMLHREWSTPVLILLDLEMPVMDGRAFRLEQQKVPRLAEIPVVLFSGSPDVDKVALSLNVAAAMTKPPGLGDLVTLVDQLSRSRIRN